MRARKLTARGLRALILDEASKAKKSEDGVMTRVYDGKKYTASAGSVASLEKHGMSAEKAVKAGDFDWASNPMAAAQAAHIVASGKPTVPKGAKISESQLRSMIRHQLLEDIDGGSVEKALGTVLKPVDDKLDRALKLAKNDKQKAAALQMILDKMGITGEDAVKVLKLVANDERSEKESKNPMK